MAKSRIPLDPNSVARAEREALLERTVAELGLNIRTLNALEERGIFTVRDLLNCTRKDLLSIANFGEKTLEDVYCALEKIGFSSKSQ